MNFEIHCNYIWIDPIVKYFFKNKINWKVILSYKKLSDIRINYLCIALKSESIKCFIICFLLININIWFTWSHNSLIIDWKDSFIISYVQKCRQMLKKLTKILIQRTISKPFKGYPRNVSKQKIAFHLNLKYFVKYLSFQLLIGLVKMIWRLIREDLLFWMRCWLTWDINDGFPISSGISNSIFYWWLFSDGWDDRDEYLPHVLT